MHVNGIGQRRLQVAIAVGALLASAGASVAQDMRVEVTGSNIKRIEGEGALPVQIIDRREIERSGATNAMEIMNLISANNTLGSVSVSNVIGATTFGNQTASLRGLGGSSTLVLVNGKRLGTFSGGISGAEGVNLAAIPFAAIERVEVLKDGASAVYGSDAIAGVINFITRQDFSGVDATAWYGAPTRSGGGEQYQAMGTVGYGNLTKDKYNAFISVNYNEQKALNQNERNFSSSGYLPDINVNTTSGQIVSGFHLDRRHRQSGVSGMRSVDRGRQSLPLRSGARSTASTRCRRRSSGTCSPPDAIRSTRTGRPISPVFTRIRRRGSSSSRIRSPIRSSRLRPRRGRRTSCCRRRAPSIRPRSRSRRGSTASR